MDAYKPLLAELDEQLRFLHLEIESPLEQCVIAIDIVLKTYDKIKKIILKNGFKNQSDEIHFFKRVKPQILSKVIYYNHIFIIESHKPSGGVKILRKYLNNELNKLKHFFENNLEFYRYFRTNADYLDHKYFVRDKHDIKLSIDSFYFDFDFRFCTSHDYKIAKIISNDQVQVYIETELMNLERNELKTEQSQKSQVNHKSPIFWTSSKASLIGLMYALHSSGCINNGTAELKQIADFVEEVFEIDLGQFNRVFLEIRSRKMGRTKFIDTLKESLIKRMDEADDLL